MFSGTLRLNLDPFDKYTDEDLWRVLEISHLKSFVSTLEEGLEHLVSEGGENLRYSLRWVRKTRTTKNLTFFKCAMHDF